MKIPKRLKLSPVLILSSLCATFVYAGGLEIDLSATNKVFSIVDFADKPSGINNTGFNNTGFGNTGFNALTQQPTDIWNISAADHFSTNGSPTEAQQFPESITQLEDLYAVQVELLDGRKLRIHTHLFGPEINIIPYGDGDKVKDASGNHHRGDQFAAEYYSPGDIGYTIKHHRSSNRVLDPKSGSRIRNDIKLQDSHIGIVVGIVKNGTPSVITINNPQGYQNGGFGDSTTPGDYPMVFAKPAFPSDIPEPTKKLFIDNIRTMTVGFNTVSRFPPDYDGGDPLAITSLEALELSVKMMVQAVAGDSKAQEYFEDPINHMYCAELAYVATSAGLQVPLNAKTLLGLGISQEDIDTFSAEIESHNNGDPNSYFISNNDNKNIQYVQLANLQELENLESIISHSKEAANTSATFAFQAMTMADIIDGFMKVYFPRNELGEEFASDQARILEAMKPGIAEMLLIDFSTDEGIKLEKLFDEIVVMVGQEYENYEAFRSALRPYMIQARQMTGGGGFNLFTPPSLFHLVLSGHTNTPGLIGLDYVGHGVHLNLLKTPQIDTPSLFE